MSLYRKHILPIWIRFFSWIFLVFYISPIIWVMGINGNVDFKLFGLTHIGSSLHPIAIFIALVLLLYAHTARAILWGKNNAISLGIASACIGIAITVGTMLYSLFNGVFTMKYELLVLLLFLNSLIKNKEKWILFDEEIEG